MSEVPVKFLGKFKLERSENFDEYLASRGVNWFLRKMICFTTVTKTFERSVDESGKYNAHNISAKGDTAYLGWALGEQFNAKGLDGKEHKITFNVEDNGNTLTEQHIRMDEDKPVAENVQQEQHAETYRYTINEEDKLVLTLINGQITANRFFKRI